MYRVAIAITIDAAHRLENYPGPCARLHGHTYTITGEWERVSLDRIGMALDMVVLKKQLRAVVVDMDHCFLNKVRELHKPTAENMTQLLFKRLEKRMPSGEFLVAVTVEETPGCSVRYEAPKTLASLGEEPKQVKEPPANELVTVPPGTMPNYNATPTDDETGADEGAEEHGQ